MITTPDDSARRNDAPAPLYWLVAGYYLLTSLFLFWSVDSFLKDILIAPLYFLLPAGAGLLLFSIGPLRSGFLPQLTPAQLLLGAATVGFVAITILYQELERLGRLAAVFPYLYFPLKVLSFAGWHRQRQALRVGPGAARRFGGLMLLLLPFAAGVYYFEYILFSAYPLRDLFQQTLFMKGANELARTGILNPFVSDSYLPVIPLFLGILKRFYAFDELNAQWILPWAAYFFHLACYGVFLASIVRSDFAVRASLLFLTLLAPMFSFVNMALLESMLLVLFSTVLRLNSDVASSSGLVRRMGWLPLLFVAYALYFNYLAVPPSVELDQPPKHYTILWLSVLSVFTYVALAASRRRTGEVAFLALSAVSVFAMHRAILLFFPILVFLYIVYFFVVQRSVALPYRTKLSSVRGAIIITSLVVAAVTTFQYHAYASNTGYGPITNDAVLDFVRSFIYDGGFYSSGTGFLHSLSEYLRVSPPLLHLLALGLVVSWFAFAARSRRVAGVTMQYATGAEVTASDVRTLDVLVFLALSLSLLLALTLSTFPYAFRAAFFPMLLLVMLVACCIRELTADRRRESSGWWLYGSGIVAVLYVSAGLGYFYNPDSNLFGRSYLAPLFPYALVLAMAAGAVFLVLMYSARKRHLVRLLVPVFIALAVLIDVASIKTMFYEKGYGAPLPASGVIAHYSNLETRVAKKLRDFPAETILVTDPGTYSILRALTGLNGPFTFSNIDVMVNSDSYRSRLKLLAGLEQSNDRHAIQDALQSLARWINAGLPGQTLYALHRLPATQGKSRESLKENIVWVISERTLRWAFGHDSYYTDNSVLSARFIEGAKKCFDVIENFEDRVLVLRLKVV